MRFFVVDENDVIQNCHLRGDFYERQELEIITHHVKESSLIVDIGSNVGNHALFFDKFLLASKVILFEVNPDAIEILICNGLLNKCLSWDTSYLGYAVSDNFRRFTKRPRYAHNLGATQFIEDPEGRFRSIVLDSVLAGQRIDFIKIDVEGGETAVLSGLKETIARWNPTVFVELEDRHIEWLDAWRAEHRYVIATTFQRYPGMTNYLLKST